VPIFSGEINHINAIPARSYKILSIIKNIRPMPQTTIDPMKIYSPRKSSRSKRGLYVTLLNDFGKNSTIM
jgi:hypothetical protein